MMIKATSEQDDVVYAEILSEKSRRVRRNTLVLAVILFAIHYYGERIDWTGLSLFGLKAIGEKKDTQQLIQQVLLFFLAVQSILFLWYAQRDFRYWKTELIKRSSGDRLFKELRMFFGMKPSKRLVKNAGWDRDWLSRDVGDGNIIWRIPQDKCSRGEGPIKYGHNKSTVWHTAFKVVEFVVIDCGIPLIVIVVSVVAHFT